MIEQIKNIFDQTLALKLTFSPEIRVKKTTQAEPVWIDSISKVRDQYLVHTSNRKDKAILNLKNLDANALSSLHERMTNLFKSKIK